MRQPSRPRQGHPEPEPRRTVAAIIFQWPTPEPAAKRRFSCLTGNRVPFRPHRSGPLKGYTIKEDFRPEARGPHKRVIGGRARPVKCLANKAAQPLRYAARCACHGPRGPPRPNPLPAPQRPHTAPAGHSRATPSTYGRAGTSGQRPSRANSGKSAINRSARARTPPLPLSPSPGE